MTENRPRKTTAQKKRKKPDSFLRKNYAYVLLAGTFLVAALGLVLPGVLLSGLQKRRMAGVSSMEIGTQVNAMVFAAEQGEPLTLDVLHALTRASMAADISYGLTPSQETMGEEAAVAALRRELEQMEGMGLVPLGSSDFSDAQYTALRIRYDASYGEDAKEAQDVWDIAVYRKDITISAALHAASGKVLSLTFSYQSADIRRVFETWDMAVDAGPALDIRIETEEGMEMGEDAIHSASDLLDENYYLSVYEEEAGETLERVSLNEYAQSALFVDAYTPEDSARGYLEYLGFSDTFEYLKPEEGDGANLWFGNGLRIATYCFAEDVMVFLQYEVTEG